MGFISGKKYIIYFFLLLIVVYSCDNDEIINSRQNITYTYQEISIDHEATGNGVYHLETTDNVNLNFHLDLGSTLKDVYFIFTNVNLDDSGSLNNILQLNDITDESTKELIQKNINTQTIPDYTLRSKPEIAEFNENPDKFLSSDNLYSQSLLRADKSVSRALDIEGQSQTFIIDSDTSINAHCVRVVSDSSNSRTLNVWVADDCWAETPGDKKSFVVNSTMVNQLAEKFLMDGSDNDIYDWVTGIYGDEWGAWTDSIYDSRLVEPDNTITILLFDIDDDDNNFLLENQGVYTGYFWAKDNYLSHVSSFSNERIMFYIDAVVFAYPFPWDPDLADPYINWNLDDPYPGEIVLTLAHELQHMIHFYQKNILRANGRGWCLRS